MPRDYYCRARYYGLSEPAEKPSAGFPWRGTPVFRSCRNGRLVIRSFTAPGWGLPREGPAV